MKHLIVQRHIERRWQRQFTSRTNCPWTGRCQVRGKIRRLNLDESIALPHAPLCQSIRLSSTDACLLTLDRHGEEACGLTIDRQCLSSKGTSRRAGPRFHLIDRRVRPLPASTGDKTPPPQNLCATNNDPLTTHPQVDNPDTYGRRIWELDWQQ
jgi:hypothetical protein